MKKLIITFLLGLTVVTSAAPRKRHLFIFSGENNMQSMRPERVIIPVLEKDKELRKADLLWVRDAHRTLSMRDVDAGWKDEKKKTKTKFYKNLLKRTRQAAKKKECDTIVLFWMQGESDAKNEWGEKYAASFTRFVTNFEKDLGLGKVDVVITRLNDYGIEKKNYPDWEKVRQVQDGLVKKNKNWKLVNTDDFNGTLNKLKFDKKGLEKIGEIYVNAAKKFTGATKM